MAKKKKKLKIKITKKQKQLLVKFGVPALIGFVCLNIGIIGTKSLMASSTPKNIVWAADGGVVMPKGLKSFLEKQDDCQAYRGAGSPQGVGLWSVYQVHEGKFAKIAYGCSWNLTTYIMAVKEKAGWKLIRPAEYFAPFKNSAATGAIPACTALQTYGIDKTLEPFCVQPDGTAVANEL